jgi:hypothetical protein
MGKLPGTSYVISQDGKAEFTVELARFGIAHPLPGIEAISLVIKTLEIPVRAAELGPVSLGKVISNSAQSEAGLYIDLSFTEGASVGAVCPRVTDEVKLTVARSSRALRGVVWASLAVCVLGGLVLSNVVFTTWDPQLRFAVGLLLGALVAVGVIALLSKSQLLAGGRSGELSEQLAAVVAQWVDGDPANAEPPQKKRKKKKRKKRRVVVDDDES